MATALKPVKLASTTHISKADPQKGADKALGFVRKQVKGFVAPPGDVRLTVNIRQDLHKRLKIAAIERGTTAGEMIEQWIESKF